MKEQDRIPTSKVARAMKFVKTGAQIGGNYVKHYSKKVFNPDLDKSELHRDNAEDVYNTLSELKGSALKVAQMLSMDRTLLPQAYSDKFTMAQYQAPPLSGPLIVQTFKKAFGKTPQDIFDRFDMKSLNAASIGQVHQAEKDGQKLAVKIQYPGVGESIQSDLRMVKPIAMRMVGLSEREMDKYIKEVEAKLLEETDYHLELKRSQDISEVCATIPHTAFAKYYPEYSSAKVLTMDWMAGQHLNEFLKTNPSQEVRDRIGQAMWEFYDLQVHQLKAVHADPHPGNFLMQPDGTLGIIDFGCVKEIPEDFYYNYFALVVPELVNDPEVVEKVMFNIEILFPEDAPEAQEKVRDVFMQMNHLLGKPFREETFDFGNDAYLAAIYALGEEVSTVEEIRKSQKGQSRGSQHALYIHRTYFGLYSILNQLKARIRTGDQPWKQDLIDFHHPEVMA